MAIMNSTDCKLNAIIKRLDTLIGSSADLEKAIGNAGNYDEVITCLEDTIDEHLETIDILERIRGFLIEVNSLEQEDTQKQMKKADQAEPVNLKESILNYEKMSAEKIRCLKSTVDFFINYGYARPVAGPHFREAREGTDLPEDDSVAMLFYDADTCRLFPFEHVLRICPWLNERSVMRAIPEMPGLYYLYEENTEIENGKGTYLVGPVVVIKLDAGHFLVTPNAMDRHLIRSFMKENTEAITFSEGNSYEAFRRI